MHRIFLNEETGRGIITRSGLKSYLSYNRYRVLYKTSFVTMHIIVHSPCFPIPTEIPIFFSFF